ncbi:MotA/TolQ/ExbB proton channel family protein [Oligoflexus tunisiensis]|uniref:MotA/TolQ/ExbB proton channel family protein n=1 Tax=Oligoflexus tunisiensis TaxID=708132 RepID=UPI00114CF48C|nr:MotA/TolQ/ExbB proton channel family protein [Oligoflexus tunisiensis]
MWSQLAVSLQNGNLYLIAIIALGFIGTIIVFERLIMLQFVYNIDFKKFLNNLRRSVQAEDLERAVSICKNASYTSLPSIGLKALEALERDPHSVRGTIEEETIDFLPRLEARISILPALSTLILLIGILGTIDGLWAAFDSIEILDTSEKQARLANGIAGSLNPTTMGLLMSMLFLTGHQMLRGLAIRLTERVHYGVSVLINLLAPQEMATYVAAPMAEAAPVVQEPVISKREAAPVESKTEVEDDSFDDASVEDIKDEEEII